MAVDKEKIDELGSPNFGLLCTAWVFFIFSAIWIGDAPFIIIAAPFLFLIRKFTKPHPLDYLVEGKDEYPYTRKGAYWNALQLWFLSVFVLVPILLLPGFCSEKAFETEEQNFLSRSTPSEWWKTGSAFKADSRTIRRRDESCDDTQNIWSEDGQILWSIENQPFTTFMRLASILGFLYVFIRFLSIRPQHKK